MIDYNCFCGNWPFHRIRRNTFSDILSLHRENNIECGYISSLEAIFYNDPFETELLLYNEIKGSGYKQVFTINPKLDIAEEILIRAVEEIDIKGVRLTPGYHGYSLDDDCVSKILRIVRKYRLPLFLTFHFEDDRVWYLMEYKALDTDGVNRLIIKNPDIEILLCNIRYNEVVKLKDSITGSKNVSMDSSGIRGDILKIKENNLIPYVKFGSMAPLYSLKSVLMAYEEIQK